MLMRTKLSKINILHKKHALTKKNMKTQVKTLFHTNVSYTFCKNLLRIKKIRRNWESNKI